MARVFTPEWLEELKSRCDIADTISKYVPLKQNGRELVGCCPFHHEKTPSFFVYPDTQSYHCFGCKASGDVIKFLRDYENWGFIETVERLANSVNLPLPELKDIDAKLVEQKKKERSQILSALKDAARYYFDNLFTENRQALVARKYLDKRQITRQSIVQFGLGCSLDYESSINFLHKKGYSDDILKKAGLIGETNGRKFDAFAKRLTFPLINKDGEVIGFSARLLENKDLVKYKNTAATQVFNKSEVVFGINLIKKLRDENREQDYDGLKNLIIVEGQVDVISMRQFDFKNTVACLGTALTPMHARVLKQFTGNIILLLDGDGAGQKATLRSIDVLRSAALNVRVASLPTGMDPDEFLHSYGAEAMQKLLNNACDGIEFKIDVLTKKYDLNDINSRTKFVKESLVVIKNLEDSATQDIYLTYLQKYCSIPIEVLRQDLANIRDNETPYYERETPQEVVTKPPIKKDGYMRADLFVLASILYSKDYINDVDISDLWFEDTGLNDAFTYITQAQKSGRTPNMSGLFSYLQVENSTDLLKELVSYEFTRDDFPGVSYRSAILKNKERYLIKKRNDLQASLNKADKPEQEEILRKIMEINLKLEELRTNTEKLNQEYIKNLNSLTKRKNKKSKED